MNKTLIAVLAVVAFYGLFLAGKYFYQTPKFINGEPAPDFSTKLINGETAKLSDLRGKYVLLQFWASWCGPCRHENPELVGLFQKYQAGGFEIFSIAVERSEQAWRAAIVRDGMGWKYHAAELTDDLKFFKGPVVELYKVRTIPQTYLLDPSGVIIGVNFSPKEIEKVLSTRLTK